MNRWIALLARIWGRAKRQRALAPQEEPVVHLHPNKHLITVPRNRGWTNTGEKCIIPAGTYAISGVLFNAECPNPEHITVIFIHPPEGGTKYTLGGNIPYIIKNKYPGEKI